jgi:hypothetical protein
MTEEINKIDTEIKVLWGEMDKCKNYAQQPRKRYLQSEVSKLIKRGDYLKKILETKDMTLQEQVQEFNEFAEKQADIMLKKGNDYANEDRLSNFKLVAQITGLTPEQVIMVFIATKTVRLGNLIASGKAPNNESIEDNLLDSSNYNQLLNMIRNDKTTK